MEYNVETAHGNFVFLLERKKVRNMRLKVSSEAKVMVSAPFHVSQSAILNFVKTNSSFIMKQTAKINYVRASSYPLDYKDGDMFSFLGQRILLSVSEGKQKALLIGGVLVITMTEPHDRELCRQIFIKWAKKKAKEIFEQRLSIILPSFRNVPSDIKISVRDMKTRWGSINVKKHTMSLSVHLLRCELEVVDHIVMHELCHYFHQNHSRDFYDELCKHNPDYKAMQKRLKEYGLVGF